MMMMMIAPTNEPHLYRGGVAWGGSGGDDPAACLVSRPCPGMTHIESADQTIEWERSGFTLFIQTCMSKHTLQIYPITETCLFKYTENFTPKNENFQSKNSGIFHISAQNIDCGYSLEPPRRFLLYKSGVQWGSKY